MMLNGITKSFPGVLALRGVSLVVRPGTVHALCGENGAGKSTLIKIATGAQQADSGTIEVGGVVLHRPNRRQMQARGVRAIFQERQIASDLSVTENVLLDRLPTRFGRVDWRRAKHMAAERLAALEIDIDLNAPVRSLTVAQLQMMEIARAVSFDARLVVMDEPTASLSRHEVEPLFRIVDRLRRAGVAILFISHHLDEVFTIADDVTVMRDGEVVAQGQASDFTPVSVVEAMFGRKVDITRVERASADRSTNVLLAIDGACSNKLDHVTLSVASGEIVAVTGGVGAGVSDLARVAAGAMQCGAGTVAVADASGAMRSIRGRRQALSLGVAFLPADRKRQGLLLDRTVSDNIVLGQQADGRSIVLPPSRLRRVATHLVPSARVKTATVDVTVGTLSGGNQQKVMIGRWMGVDSKVLIFDEPTAGIDIASKFEIYAELRRLADGGAAVLICSTDFQEVGQVADRVIVMRSGRIVGEVAGHDATEHHLLQLESGLEMSQ
ncbi:MAG: sugar ABC transporter ATP-binding protein [Ilumatobacteraceae bacterium]